MNQNIKDNFKIIGLLSATFIIPFLTTFLLDLEFINRSIPRAIIIYLLIILQFTAGIGLLVSELKRP